MNLNEYLQLTPAHFIIGFAEGSDLLSVTRVIDSAYRPVSVAVGPCQALAM
jgi:hypothetical protein